MRTSNFEFEFESFVNSEEYQTHSSPQYPYQLFESFVNSEEYQTAGDFVLYPAAFESFVNSEEYQTTGIVTFDYTDV